MGWAPELSWCLTLPWAKEEEGWGLHPTAQSFLALSEQSPTDTETLN